MTNGFADVIEVVTQSPEDARGSRGDHVGTSSAGDRVKRAWRVSGKHTPLKTFAKTHEDGNAWMEHKKELHTLEAQDARYKKHGARISAEKAATKLARKKSK